MSLILPDRRYNIIYADPPWSYRDKAKNGRGGAEDHYSTMTTEQIGNINVQDISHNNCALLLWATMPLLHDALYVMDVWGFDYKTCAFTWVKTNKNDAKFCKGLGHYTRSNAELCLLGIRGRMQRVNKSVDSIVVAERRKHSEKPPVVRKRIVELFGDIPRIEMFARTVKAGWDAIGNQLCHANKNNFFDHQLLINDISPHSIAGLKVVEITNNVISKIKK